MISNLIKKDFLLVKKSVAAFLGISILIRSVYKELHADHETGAADNK